MIRIPTYKEHSMGKKIYDRYLFLAAFVLPFSPQEVLGDDIIEVDGQTYTAGNFIKESGKKPRRRTIRANGIAYKDLVNRYGNGATSKEGRFKDDQRIAANLIYKDKKLYEYLYEDAEDPINYTDPPSVICHKLRKLLLMPMNDICPELSHKPACAEALLNQVFRYEVFSQHKQAYRLLEDMDVNVCPYCNRIFTNTVIKGEKGLTRPQFDHYLSKKNYPQFAISLLNLVPSCGICNQVKSDRMEKVMYPYADEFGMDMVFRISNEKGMSYLFGDRGAEDQFDVVLEQTNINIDADLAERMNNSEEIFHLTELYNKHKDYILFLFRMRYMFNEDYIETLKARFYGLFDKEEDIHSILYLMDIEKEEWGRRPLSKLTHDINMIIP